MDTKQLNHAVIASIVPTLDPKPRWVCSDYCGVEALIVGPGVKTGMSILYENPKEVGADHIVNAVAA